MGIQHTSTTAPMPGTFQPKVRVRCQCRPPAGQTERPQMQPLSLSTLCALRGRPPFRGAVTKDSTWHPHSSLPRGTNSKEFWCPFLWDHCQRGYTALARKTPRGPRSLGDQGRLAFIYRPCLPPNGHRSLEGRRGHAVCSRGAATPGHARVRTERAPGRWCQALPPSWLPAQARALAVPFLRLVGLARQGSGQRELEQRPYRPLFRLHLLHLLLLSPSNPRIHNRFRLARVPRKEERSVWRWGGVGRGEHRE